MSTVRIDRMIRELDSDPSHQFFTALFGLMGLAESTEKARRKEDSRLATSILRSVLAR